ncbi:8-oxo-dGTP diphosphatase [Peribacillus deserti]|uniref:8-oxo-dGTP diphosphatase n=1 Tax=Peribacillus deserti TaxID=673318 RepID=A0ABS2QIJ0_9BACI|nr:nucleoside triphosphatase YtkD [Peribacillus deserti]MBM7692976.1 8-oxo-dGTP diphosphatase [Peribacillus deserti]
MERFLDQNGCIVSYFEDDEDFLSKSRHVLVICSYKNKWVLTRHRVRGLEFPGGKVEDLESIRDAAVREVYEETGGAAGSLYYLGSYCVECADNRFYKSIFFTKLKSLETRDHYLETDGPLLAEDLPVNLIEDDRFSFIMKDRVIEICLDLIERRGLNR